MYKDILKKELSRTMAVNHVRLARAALMVGIPLRDAKKLFETKTKSKVRYRKMVY